MSASDLIDEIRRAQVRAGEAAVLRNLRSKGMLSAEGATVLDRFDAGADRSQVLSFPAGGAGRVDEASRLMDARIKLSTALYGDAPVVESLEALVIEAGVRVKRLAALEVTSAPVVDETPAKRTWICKRCSVDRFVADCPQRDGCPMVGTAQLF